MSASRLSGRLATTTNILRPGQRRKSDAHPLRRHSLLLQYVDLTGRGDEASLLALLDQVIERDPDFAAAHGFEASLYANRLINTTRASIRS
ncbi:MAG TPA: hypothetical protein VIN61_15995 [Gammaproteobacteria bacterium]